MIYLDNAATGFPKYKSAVLAMTKAAWSCGNAGRSGCPASTLATSHLYQCREALAEQFNTEPERVILTPNTTLALNMAIKGTAGQHIVMSSMEHNSVCRPVYALARQGIDHSIFDVSLSSDAKTIESFNDIDGADTLVFTHASNVCGRVLPAKKLCSAAKSKGMTVIIDAAQTAGHFPIDIDEIGADILCIAGHKGFFGPLGTGAMIISRAYNGALRTILEGGSGVYSLDADMPYDYPERLESGTLNSPAFAGLCAAVSQHDYAFDHELFRLLHSQISNMRHITLHGAPIGNCHKYTPVLLFNIAERDSEEVAEELAVQGFCVRGGYHCAPLAHRTLGTSGGVRVSLGRFNTKRHIMRFIDAVAKMA